MSTRKDIQNLKKLKQIIKDGELLIWVRTSRDSEGKIQWYEFETMDYLYFNIDLERFNNELFKTILDDKSIIQSYVQF